MKHIKDFLRLCAELFFHQKLELRTKIFHVLAIAGVLICIAMTILAFSTGMMVSAIINMTTGAFSLALLIYSVRGGRQQICYLGTVIAIFLVLFPTIFVFGGGYRSGMVFFFVFAAVYTVYMLDGRRMIVCITFELIYYTGFLIFAYLFPEYIHPLLSELDVLIDTVVGFLVTSLSLSITTCVQFRMYQKQQKELESARTDAEIANQAKSTFLANMSHEIRTPIHVIMNVNELIARETDDVKIMEYAEKIHSSGEMLRSLVDNILDMSKIEAGKMELHETVYRTKDLFSVLELTGQTQCKARNLKFTAIHRDIPSHLYGDLSHIQQIGINLLSNAAKYTETGSVTLSISCEATEHPQQVSLQLSVIDTGIGIREEHLPGLFDAFNRADLLTHRRIEGTGLGLAIVKELCRRMGGSVRVESRYHWGSKFTVELPQRIPDPESVKEAENTDTFLAPDGRILLVDDNRENLLVLRELLARTQLQTDVAFSGREAVMLADQTQYHLILLDYMMPEMDGVETLQALHALPGFSTPVIVLTADAFSETKEKLEQAGFAAYLTKPVSRVQLEQQLMEYLPHNLVTIVHPSSADSVEENRQPDEAYEKLCQELTDLLHPLGIDLPLALPYFDGELTLYGQTTALFLRHYPAQQEKLREFCQQTPSDLSPALPEHTLTDASPEFIYLVHSLKGRAKNLGIVELAAEAEHVERLCRKGEITEAQSLLPHLLYLNQCGAQALKTLQEELKHREIYTAGGKNHD